MNQLCYHCGSDCTGNLVAEERHFCCNGCMQVYLLLTENNLCNYYELSSHAGISAKGKFTGKKYDYLDDEDVINRLTLFKSDHRINVIFSLPQIHCASCIYLLEKLNKINTGILHSRVNFTKKEIFISFDPHLVSLRKVVETLSFVGYEPAINLNDSIEVKDTSHKGNELIRIGLAGFCFSNIMMLSFPDYFSGGHIETTGLKTTFSYISLLLSLPVLIFSAVPIFQSAYHGLRQRSINIDAPIALAIIITFSRSYVDILSGQGAGFLDSGTGIIFFMLIGRWFQQKTFDTLSFSRKYQSYFPLGVTVKRNEAETTIPLNKLEVDDILIVRNNELIPADAILVSKSANIDYSFVNGEDNTFQPRQGELIYAGGKQIGQAIELRVVKAPSQSYITELWNNEVFHKHRREKESFVHPWSRYFSMALLSVAITTGVYWILHDKNIWLDAFTSVLIIACPCSLLLTATFTTGNMLRVTGKHKLYLKNASVIESFSDINHIVFDKTGTITSQSTCVTNYIGIPLSAFESSMVKSAVSNSAHTLSQAVKDYLKGDTLSMDDYTETSGKGITASLGEHQVELGSRTFINLSVNHTGNASPEVHVRIDGHYKGYFTIQHAYREGIFDTLNELSDNYTIHILSGDNDAEGAYIAKNTKSTIPMMFNASPELKLKYIKNLQVEGSKILMIGDGLNDAGALKQADTGIAVSDHSANFTPASDGIIDGSQLRALPQLLRYLKMNKRIVTAGFSFSIMYNIVGLAFAVQGLLQPVVAAILMPLSSISIVTMSIVLTNYWESKLLLTKKHHERTIPPDRMQFAGRPTLSRGLHLEHSGQPI